ncbi:MAG: N-acetylmuramoyl-L-alanine amidase [Casimicrobium sp.]
MTKKLCAFSMLALVASALLAGCATSPPPGLVIDTSTTAVSQDSRVQHLILHFTTVNNPLSLKILSQGPVSSHYLVTERVGDTPPKIMRLVDENRRAFHAGVSYWKGAAGINASSIGIEIVNLGGRKGPYSLEFQSFDDEQMALVIELSKDIVARHGIKPERVLGHSDIAPTRKNDPGPKFPWKRFADAGLILWPDAALVAQKRVGFDAKLPDVKWFQEKMKAHGFEVPQHGDLDRATRDVISAFQMKYRPTLYDGQPDAETAAMVDALVAQSAVRK